jgi:hypothetical protein
VRWFPLSWRTKRTEPKRSLNYHVLSLNWRESIPDVCTKKWRNVRGLMDTTKLWTETINRFAEVNNQCLALKIYGTHNPSCSAYRLQFYGLLRRKFKSTNRHFKGWCIVTDAIATLARCVSRQRWNPSSLFYHASGPIRFVLRLSQTLRCPCLVLCVSMGHNTSIHTFGVLSSNLQTVPANATGR